MIIIDSVWIVGASNFHKNSVRSVQGSDMEVNLLPAMLFYILAPLGYLFFVDKLAKTPRDAFMYGSLLGLLMYGTFDLTNKAIFKGYTWAYTLADMAWGTFCMGLVSTIIFATLK